MTKDEAQTWTTTLPTEPGTYKRRDRWGNEETLHLFDEQDVIWTADLSRKMKGEGIEWLGPLSPPAREEA